MITLENITKSFGAHIVLDNISAQIYDHHRIGLIGSNGAGKTTLLNILYGSLESDSGRVLRKNDSTFGFLRQNNGLDDNNTIYKEMRGVFAKLDNMHKEMKNAENTLPTLDTESLEYVELAARYASLQNQYELGEGYQIDAKIATVLNGLGFESTPWEKSISVLSGGEKTRLAICKLLLQSPDLLILDEPTNHLDFPTLLWLEDYLLSYKGALLIVSHDRYFLNKICTTIWEVENKTLEIYSGNYSKYLVEKEERETLQQKQHNMQKTEIEKMKDFIARNIVRASTTKRAQSRQKALDKMEITSAPLPPPKPPNLQFDINRDPVSDVLIVDDLSLSVGDNDLVKLFSHLDLHIRRGEKIAVVGQNGIGKSSFLKAVLGKIQYDSGSITWGRNTDVSYFEQGEGEMVPSNSVIDELWNSFPSETENTIRSVLGRAALRGEEVYKKVGELSGGERARLKFSKLMLEKGNVLLLDEPTNHLDLPTKEALDKALEKYEGTLLVVSHDRYLLNKFPDRIIEMYEDKIKSYRGRYDDYSRQKLAEKQNPSDTKVSPKEEASDNVDDTRSNYRTREDRRLAAERRQRFSQLELEIHTLEEEIELLEKAIQDPTNSSDYQLLDEKCTLLDESKIILKNSMDEWLELADYE